MQNVTCSHKSFSGRGFLASMKDKSGWEPLPNWRQSGRNSTGLEVRLFAVICYVGRQKTANVKA